MIFAVVDIGSRTLRLAIYERKDGEDVLLTKTKIALGLAGYLKNNVMTEEGILVLLGHLKEFKRFLDAFGITNIYTFATAAVRMSENRAEILERVKSETGFSVQVISGEEEAELAFVGATKDSPVKAGALFDIGGGSCEIVRFDGDKILNAYSLPIGAVSLAKKYDGEFFPDKAVREHIKSATMRAITDANASFKASEALALGGAAKGAKLLLNRSTGDLITKAELDGLLARFSGDLTEDDKTLLLKIAPDRASILITGFIMLSTLMEVFGAETFYNRDGGVREGYIDKYV